MDAQERAPLGQLLGDAIRFARCGEKLMAAASTLAPAGAALTDLSDFDPELTPEITVAIEHVLEALKALERASVFIDARFDAALAALGMPPLDQEGDPS